MESCNMYLDFFIRHNVHPHCSMHHDFIPFLRLNNIPLYGHTTFCLSIHPLMDIWVVSTFWPLWIMNNAVMNIGLQVSFWTPDFSSFGYTSIQIAVKLLGHMVTVCLTCARLLSTVATPFYISTSSVWVFQFLHILVNTYYYPYFLF